MYLDLCTLILVHDSPSHSLDYLGGGRISLEAFLLDFSTADFGRYVMATVVGLLCTCTHAYVYLCTESV